MTIRTLYIGSEGPFKYDDQIDLDDPDGLFVGYKQGAIITDGDLDVRYIKVESLEASQIDTLSAESYFYGVM